jgi:hypothetical protein
LQIGGLTFLVLMSDVADVADVAFLLTTGSFRSTDFLALTSRLHCWYKWSSRRSWSWRCGVDYDTMMPSPTFFSRRLFKMANF